MYIPTITETISVDPKLNNFDVLKSERSNTNTFSFSLFGEKIALTKNASTKEIAI